MCDYSAQVVHGLYGYFIRSGDKNALCLSGILIP